MTKKRSARCSIDVNGLSLRLRWHYEGRRYSKTFPKWRNTEAGWEEAWKLQALVQRSLGTGKDPRPALRMPVAAIQPDIPVTSKTVREYYEVWIEDKRPPKVLPAQARDYRRHISKYVLPHLGNQPIGDLTPRDLVNLQTVLLNQPLSPFAKARMQMARRAQGEAAPTLSAKMVKNIMLGSFAAMLRDAQGIDLIPVKANLFVGLKTGWGEEEREQAEADPFTPEERDKILMWFAGKRFGSGPGTKLALQIHPPYSVYVYTLFWTGMRPSEAAGLRWTDLDLERGLAHIRGARHSYVRNKKTKTKAARRSVELTPKNVELLRAMMPLRVEPEMPVFTNMNGEPVEPKVFSSHWYRALRSIGLRVRGLYATKDTYVSIAMTRAVNQSWLESQTGVAWATLRKHYGRFMHEQAQGSEITKIAEIDTSDRAGSVRTEATRRR